MFSHHHKCTRNTFKFEILKKQPIDEKFSYQGQVQNIGSNSLFSGIYSAVSFYANKYCQDSSKRKPFRVPFLLLETVVQQQKRQAAYSISSSDAKKCYHVPRCTKIKANIKKAAIFWGQRNLLLAPVLSCLAIYLKMPTSKPAKLHKYHFLSQHTYCILSSSCGTICQSNKGIIF